MFKTTRNQITRQGFAKLSTLAFAVALFVKSAFAQESDSAGILSGSVIDADFGGGVAGARVSIIGTEHVMTTDKDGRFLFTSVAEGTYTLLATANFFKTSTVEDLGIVGGEVAKLDIPIYGDESDIVELDGFVVKAKALEGSSLALLADRQRSSSISDAIGSESFSRLGIGDAADAMSKVPGASVVDGKYVVVRGLSDRYNNTTLNGSSVPSADPDRRAVQLDQFPSAIIESVNTQKTFSPDKTGNFTGGLVDVVTSSVPPAGFMSFSVGFEYNEKTSFGDYLTYEGGGDDWLGKDDGTRAVPSIVPNDERLPLVDGGLSPERLAVVDEAAKAFSSQLVPHTETAPLSSSFSVAFGDRFPLGEEAVLGVIGSLTYGRSYSAYDDGLVARYETTGTGSDLDIETQFTESKGTESTQWGMILNTALTLGSDHEFGVKTMFNQSGEDDAIFRVGIFPEAVDRDTFRVANLHYTERSLSSNQLYGEHAFRNISDVRLDWEIASSKSTQEEPDYRVFYDSQPAEESGRPRVGGNFRTPRRYWRELEETNDEIKFDVTVPLGERDGQIKFGFLTSETEREFSERSFLYLNGIGAPSYDGIPENYTRSEIMGLNEDGELQRFIGEFVGFFPEYTGEQSIDAGYVMIDFRPLENWRVITGARLEEAEVVVETLDQFGNQLSNDGNLDNSDWLPSVQLVREFDDNKNLRFSYSKTLARPNFRELSPFGAFDNVGGEEKIGNSDLVRSRIENLDLRYEWFMEGSDLMAVSLFSKDIENPIEQAYQEGRLTYVNVEQAEVIGVEFEASKRLAFLSNDNYEVTVGGNLSLIESTVERSETELADKRLRDPDASSERELQGQSSLIANFDANWRLIENGSSFSLVYNHTGERLYSVSQTRLPDVYQEGFDSLDFIYSQDLPKGFKMKLSLKNLLDDADSRVWSDFQEDLVYSYSDKGRSVSLSFSKRFE
ncbi:TonB-dependent receptor domain protein [Verrucomicrobiia bacterium DG1235]|nr:TonB-dependent receptor domain protein [Verrucomicrobiae bacterium DG1235]